MATKVFKSKVDGWIRLCLVATVVVQLGAMLTVATTGGEPLATPLTILACLGGAIFVVSTLVGTTYAVGDGLLVVRSGPILWKIPLNSIRTVEATRSPLSSPALSLDRPRIHYGKNRRIMVSPANRSGFLKAVGVQPGERSAGEV